MPSTHTPTRPTTTTQPDTATRGQRVELAQYDADTGARVLVGQRIDGIVHLFDEPDGDGPTFLIDDDLHSMAELEALVADYLKKAKRIGYAPMHGWF